MWIFQKSVSFEKELYQELPLAACFESIYCTLDGPLVLVHPIVTFWVFVYSFLIHCTTKMKSIRLDYKI